MDKTELTNSVIQAFNQTDIFGVKIIEGKEQAINSLRAGDVNAVLLLPKDFQSNITMGKKYPRDAQH